MFNKPKKRRKYTPKDRVALAKLRIGSYEHAIKLLTEQADAIDAQIEEYREKMEYNKEIVDSNGEYEEGDDLNA